MSTMVAFVLDPKGSLLHVEAGKLEYRINTCEAVVVQPVTYL